MKTRMESDSILEKFEVDKLETFLRFKTNVKYLKKKILILLVQACGCGASP